MSTAVSDTHVWDDVERITPVALKDITQSQNNLPATSFTTINLDNAFSTNTEATVYDNYIPEEPDVPLSEVISEAFQVLEMHTAVDVSSRGEFV